jgi:ribonuclease HI
MGKILTAQPHLLSDAQRGFIRDGAVEQCVGVLTDVVEDRRQRVTAGEDCPLFIVSYDQSKAYDAVQQYTIRATLQRFNMPEVFIRLVLSGVTDAPSWVRTFDGLTDSFVLQSSVRQGDPLSPLIYALVTDVLHEGFKSNPLRPGPIQGGYTFASSDREGCPVTIYSTGYADDTCIVASDPLRLSEMHDWVKSFCRAHHFELNAGKTKLLCSSLQDAPHLTSVDGSVVIQPLSASTTIRYLGARLNLKLNWKDQRSRMDRLVWRICERMRRYHFTLPMSVVVIKQVLLPTLRLGLLFARVPDSDLTKWDRRIKNAAMNSTGISQGRSLTSEAAHLASGLPRLLDEAWAVRGEEIMVTLNARYPSSRTAWARLGGVLWSTDHPGSSAQCRMIRQLEYLPAHVSLTPDNLRAAGACGLRASARPFDPASACSWRPRDQPRLHQTQDGHSFTVHMYTDGSTGPNPELPSGASVVVVDEGGQPVQTHRFGVRRSGNNYLVELVALLSALTLCPLGRDLCVWTDAKSARDSVNACRGLDWTSATHLSIWSLPQRKRILCAARPIMNQIRAVIGARTGATCIRHVKAHSGGTDLHSRMNDLADREANAARIEAAKSSDIPYDLAGEELVSMATGGLVSPLVPVLGSYRKQLLREFESQALIRWGCKPHQGFFAREHGRRLLSWLGVAQSTHDPDLLRFVTLACARWLPTERVLLSANRGSDNYGRGGWCKLCPQHLEDDLSHSLPTCTNIRLHSARSSMVRRAASVASCPLGPDSDPAAPARTYGSGTVLPAWFDPQGNFTVRVCPLAPPEVVQAMRAHDPLAGLLGIMPPGADWVLGWVLGRDGGWRRRDLAETHALTTKLQLGLMSGSASLWERRCHEFEDYWASEAAHQYVQQRSEGVGVRARAKALKKGAQLQASVLPPPRTNRFPSRTAAAMNIVYTYPGYRNETYSFAGAEEDATAASDKARDERTPFRWY